MTKPNPPVVGGKKDLGPPGSAQPAADPTSPMLEKMARAMAGHFGKSFDDMALDRSELRALVRSADGFDINEPTQADCLHAAKAVLEALLAPVGLRADKIMTVAEYNRIPIKGWHMVTRSVDAAYNVGVIYLCSSPDETPDASSREAANLSPLKITGEVSGLDGEVIEF